MTTPRRGLLFHFTHLTNLNSIASTGLFADNLAHAAGRLTTEVGNRAIKGRRRLRRVGCGAGGVVADYVPFYFAARSPMLGSISQGRVPTYQGGQEDVVYLVSHVDRVLELALPFIICDRNAVGDYAAFSGDIDELDRLVDWPLMEQRMWNNTALEPERMERRMAEFLVHRHVPWDAFLGIAAFDDARCQQVRGVLDALGVTIDIRARPGWYF